MIGSPGDPDEARLRRRAGVWVEAGLVDVGFYAALRGRRFDTAAAAALDWVTVGMPDGLSPHPFLDFASLPPEIRRAWRRRKVRVVLDHLADGTGAARPRGPLAEPDDPTAARAHMIEVAGQLAARPAEPLPPDADITAQQVTWLDWAAVSDGVAARIPGRTSVVIPTHADAYHTTRAVEAVLATTMGRDVEVVVVDNGTPPHVALALAAAYHGQERVRLVRLPQNLNFAAGSNIGFARSTGRTVLFLNNDTRTRGDWLGPLLAALEDPDVAGVQPLLLYEDDTIQSAGTLFLPDQALPCHLLVGHPPQDARRVAGRRFSAATAAALAMRAEDVARLEGFDPVFRNGFEDVDLCLRALRLRPGGFRVAPDAWVTHHESKSPGRFASVVENRREFVRRWREEMPAPDAGVHEELGFALDAVELDGAEIPSPRPRVGARVGAAPGSLRWSLNLPSTAGPWGDTWGDTYFGEQLAEALSSHGQQVVLRRHGAHAAGPIHLDDVALALRGRLPIAPIPGRLNVLWVISHPDDVTREELDGFDLVFAASAPWSEARSREWGRPVRPLLQATAVDPDALHDVPFCDRSGAVFVGNTDNDRRRDIVHRAVAAGLPLAVYGRGWEGLLPEGMWKGEHVPNHELARLYRRHGVVLADHWPDMARHGFVANRVYDALAAGARVVVDEVIGLSGRFPADAVTVAGADSDLAAALADRAPLDGSVAQAVRREHSFRARAATLLERCRQELAGH